MDYKKIIDKEFGSLVGKTIKEVRPLTKKEIDLLGWDPGFDLAFAIIFTDDSFVIPFSDPEGNHPGHLFFSDDDDEDEAA